MPYDHWETHKQLHCRYIHDSCDKHVSTDWIRNTHHVRLGGELLCLQAFDGHPLHRQLDPFVILNAVVLLVIDVPRHAEVGHLDCEGFIQPEERRHLKETSSRKLLFAQVTHLETQAL